MANDVDTGLLLRLEASLAKFERQMSKARKTGYDTATDLQSKFDGMNRRMAGSAAKAAGVFERELQRTERSYQSLIASMDPAEAATQQLARAEEILNNALRRGVISTEAHARALGLAKREYAAATAAMTSGAAQAANGMRGMLNVSSGSRFVLQNTAAQLGDIAVQMEMGTDPARIMAQQVPQIAGGFAAMRGALGLLIPMLGTLAAVGIPVAAFLLRAGDNSEKSKKKVETFADALDAASAAMDRAQGAIGRMSESELESTFGLLTDKVRDLSMALTDIELRAAKLEMKDLLDFTFDDGYRSQIENMFGAVGAAIVNSGSEGAKELADDVRQQIRDLKAEISTFELTKQPVPTALTGMLIEMEQELAAIEGRISDMGPLINDLAVSPDVLHSFAELETQLEEARAAGDFSTMADLLSDMRVILDGLGDAISQDVRDKVTQAEAEARKMAKALEDSRDAAEGFAETDLAGGVSSAASEAQRLAHWLGVSLSTADRISKMGDQGVPSGGDVDENGNLYSGRGGDPRSQGGSALDWNTREATEFLEDYKPDGPSHQGTSKNADSDQILQSSQAELSSLRQRLEMMGKTRAEVAGLTLKYKLLEEAKRRGVDVDVRQTETGQTLREEIEQQAASLEELAARYDGAKERADLFTDINETLKGGLIDAALEGDNFADVLKNVAKALARAALEAALFGSGPFCGGGFLGGLGLDALIGSIFPSAKGNVFAGGRAVPFANGGVVTGPTLFPMPGRQTGLMGEAGPEAIMPLTRIGGKLGVRAQGGGGSGRVQVDVFVNDDGKIGAIARSEAQNVAVRVVEGGLRQYDNALPDRVQEISNDPRAR